MRAQFRLALRKPPSQTETQTQQPANLKAFRSRGLSTRGSLKGEISAGSLSNLESSVTHKPAFPAGSGFKVVKQLHEAAGDEALQNLLRTPLQVLILTIIIDGAGQIAPDRYSLF